MGSITLLVDLCCFYLLALFLFPALTQDDFLAIQMASVYQVIDNLFPLIAGQQWVFELTHWQVTEITESQRSVNYIIDRSLVFVVANLVSYTLSVAWVFTPGRHTRQREMTLYFIVALASFFVGTAVGAMLISIRNTDTSFAIASNIIAAILINFVCRKHIVFLR